MLIRRSGGEWEEPPVRSYEDERELQSLIAESPELVGADQAVVALREFSLPSAGSLDVLLVDVEGNLVLVEAKLNRNPEIRRAVVGQLLGYAGGLWGMSYDDLDAVVTAREGASLFELARAVAGRDDFFEAGFRAQVAQNLREGIFRLVFAVDGITEDLRRAVEYLNAHSLDTVEVVVLELVYAKVDDVEILVSHTFGEEAARRKQATRPSRRWTEEDFFDALDARASTQQDAVLIRRLFQWAEPRVTYFYWGEGQAPSCTFVFEAPEGPIQPCAVYFTGSTVGIAINFEYARKRPRAALEQMLDRLAQQLPSVAEMRQEILDKDFAKRPTVPVSEYGDEGLNTLIQVLDTLLAHPPDEGTS